MKVIFSRKGFDSAAGRAPSPIIDGEPISIPIPTGRRSETTYCLAGLAPIVEEITKGRICADDLCHEDPMFSNGRWAFGQTGVAQAHLQANGVGVGDVFLFFGLFASRGGKERHHRIFGYMQVGEVRRLGSRPSRSDGPEGFPRRHPHTIGEWEENNTLYIGFGAKARIAHPSLRLTKPGAQDVRAADLVQLGQIASGYSSRERFLTELTLDPPNATRDQAGPTLLDEDYLVLSTIHSAKGQEWTAVFLLNAIEGCLPSDLATGTTEEIEEERRLLYVTMTRAKDQLDIIVPQRFYTQYHAKLGDQHLYASRTRFIPDRILSFFELRFWQDTAVAKIRPLERRLQVDIASRARSRWR